MTGVPHSSGAYFLPWKASLGTGVSQGARGCVDTVRCVNHSPFAGLQTWPAVRALVLSVLCARWPSTLLSCLEFVNIDTSLVPQRSVALCCFRTKVIKRQLSGLQCDFDLGGKLQNHLAKHIDGMGCGQKRDRNPLRITRGVLFLPPGR